MEKAIKKVAYPPEVNIATTKISGDRYQNSIPKAVNVPPPPKPKK